MYRLLLLLCVACACSVQSGGQKAMHLDNKGITCDAVNFETNQVAICGESSKYAEQSNGSTRKDGFVILAKYGSDLCEGYTFGNGLNDFRLEKGFHSGNNFVFSGYGFEGRNALITCVNKQMETQWTYSNAQLQAFEEPAGACDAQGNILVISKNPLSTPYYAYLTLVNKEGEIKWTKKVDLVDVMSDLIPTKSGDFLMHFKQKGAYIDGTTRRKYFIAPTLRISKTGEIVSQFQFIIDREKFTDFDIRKVLETTYGTVYYFGSAISISKRIDLFIIKTDIKGTIIWANTYQTNAELAIKTAVLDDKQDIVFTADSYGHSGGMLRAGLTVNGDIKWNSFNTTKPYEQIRHLSLSKSGDCQVVYDKTLSFAMFNTNKNGLNCLGQSSTLDIKKTPAEVELSTHNSILEADNSIWEKKTIQVKSIGKIKGIIDCAK